MVLTQQFVTFGLVMLAGLGFNPKPGGHTKGPVVFAAPSVLLHVYTCASSIQSTCCSTCLTMTVANGLLSCAKGAAGTGGALWRRPVRLRAGVNIACCQIKRIASTPPAVPA